MSLGIYLLGLAIVFGAYTSAMGLFDGFFCAFIFRRRGSGIWMRYRDSQARSITFFSVHPYRSMRPYRSDPQTSTAGLYFTFYSRCLDGRMPFVWQALGLGLVDDGDGGGVEWLRGAERWVDVNGL